MASGKYKHHEHQGFQKGHRQFAGFQSGNKLGAANKGRIFSEATIKKMSKASKGRKHTDEWKAQARLRKGELSGRWKGGITPIHNQIRGSYEYKLWEDSVLSRDCHCCQRCGEKRISKLTVHHIKNFAQYPELRFAIDNGITFCRDCHKNFHHFYGKKGNFFEQVKQFLTLTF
jgi:5-methylcytosine-specific restriction endonuclease McrA